MLSDHGKTALGRLVGGGLVVAAVAVGIATAAGWAAGPEGGPAGPGVDSPCHGAVQGPGMMGGGGMMGPGMMGGGMMGGAPWGAQGPGSAAPIDAGQAAEAVAQAIARWYGQAGLRVGHLMEFDNGFYAVVEKADGSGAFEVLVDRFSGAVYPEPGPNMMWNTEYGHMGAALGAAESRGMDEASAVRQAQAYLDRAFPGATTGEVTAFPGYYTIDTARDGRTSGMLSVNAYTGQVWYHSWHGSFLAELEQKHGD